jgi:hypothetical protein
MAPTSLRAWPYVLLLHAAAPSLPTGTLQNIAVSTVTDAGFTSCYSDTYANAGTTLTSIFNGQCTGDPLLWGCMPAGGSTITLAAWGDRATLLTDVGATSNPQTQVVNGVTFYYSSSYSMGFAEAGATISRGSCDTVRPPSVAQGAAARRQAGRWGSRSRVTPPRSRPLP